MERLSPAETVHNARYREKAKEQVNAAVMKGSVRNKGLGVHIGTSVQHILVDPISTPRGRVFRPVEKRGVPILTSWMAPAAHVKARSFADDWPRLTVIGSVFRVPKQSGVSRPPSFCQSPVNHIVVLGMAVTLHLVLTNYCSICAIPYSLILIVLLLMFARVVRAGGRLGHPG